MVHIQLVSQDQQTSRDRESSRISGNLNIKQNPGLPVIGAWFWGKEEFNKDGYKAFLDEVKNNSSYTLLSTAIRLPCRDITDIEVHNQVKEAVIYAGKLGLDIALELDLRLAIQKFAALYPDELQESVWLKEVDLRDVNPAQVVIKSEIFSDHMNEGRTLYLPLEGLLVRAYSYSKTAGVIDPDSLRDITEKCKVVFSSCDSVVLNIPEVKGSGTSKACVMVSFRYLYPDVFAPHLKAFQRQIISEYSDVPMAGGMKDEWGFSPTSFKNYTPSSSQFWYSKQYALEYSTKTGGRDLLTDFLLMFVGIFGHESERMQAINNYMEMNWQRNANIENDFYKAVKETLGSEAVVVTHMTWFPYPERREYKKNGLDWWAATRDWAQTDEVTPYAVRTSLAKKWNSPVWYNQYYNSDILNYQQELWSSVLAGGRINFHPLYPGISDYSDVHAGLFKGNLMKGVSRIRLLDYISKSPSDCPVAVILGHTSVMNWAGSYYEDPGMKLVDSLCSKGIFTDLIPASEIETRCLFIDNKGWVRYGKQRYTAVILYNPEFGKISTSEFFKLASHDQTALYRMGNWTMDFDGNASLPKTMVSENNIGSLVDEIIEIHQQRKIDLQIPALRKLEGFGYVSNAPPAKGFCRLTDGTFIQAAGADDAAGDIINSRTKIGKYDIVFDAIGIAAVRLDEKGKVQALAAGGLKTFKSQNLVIQLEERIDLAFWTNEHGEIKGVIQGLKGEIPLQLMSITNDWVRLTDPVRLTE